MTGIVKKISAIIKKADSTTSPEEAETFMAKAHQMMMENGLSMLDLGKLDDDAINHDLDCMRWYGGYHGKIANALARYYGCRVVTSYRWIDGKEIQMMTLFGRESARVTWHMMFPYVLRAILRQAIHAHKNGEYRTVSVGISRIGNALARRIAQMTNASMRQYEGKGLNALVPVDLIELEMAKVFPDLKTKKAKVGKVDFNAMRRAENININAQTGAADRSRQIGVN